MKFIVRTAALVALLAVLSGCALNRSTITLPVAPASASVAAATTTAQGPAIKIVSVDDQRVFSIDPDRPAKPSLKDNAITDKAITSRAIGRKRNGFGAALGDVLLAEGDSVSAHVTAALADGFRQAGYRVLSSGDAGYDQAVPVKAVIKQYWSWIEISFALRLNCLAEVELDSPLPALTPSLTILSQVEKDEAMIVDHDWQLINQEGLQALSTKLAATLKAKGTN